MKPLNRWLSGASLIVLCAALVGVPQNVQAAEGRTKGVGKSFKGPIGLQLYSLRADFTRNVPASLKQVRDFGFTHVELAGTYNHSPERFRQMLKEHGLNPVSGHFPFDRYRTNAEAVALEAKALGLKYAGCAWIPHQGAFDEQECREAIRVFNQAGQILAKQGIHFFYHCHGYEFTPHGNGMLMDLLMQETKPEWVNFQMDVFWVVHPGQDPVTWLEKYPKRWVMLHVKDMKKGVKGNLSGGTDVTNDVALGTGQMNWPAILKTAKKIGVKYYFIEDESPSVKEQIPVSLRYLENVQF